MKIWHHRYVLNSTWHGTDHSGALLKVEFSDGKVGHADLHPWPSLGDPDLAQVLAGLAGERPWPILTRVLAIAAEDAVARAKSISLFTGHLFPSSHKLLPSIESVTVEQLEFIAQQDYLLVKAKLGKNLIEETKVLKALVSASHLKWRLDFNGRLTASEFVAWVKDVADWLMPHLDGIEDPVATDEVPQLTPYWTNAKWSQGISLMSDRVQLGAVGGGFVIKPEIQQLEPQPGRRWITNNLGHPYGHGVALAYAARWSQGEACGLQGLEDYASGGMMKPWREQIRYHGPLTLPPSGTGFGFDHLLGKLPWKALR